MHFKTIQRWYFTVVALLFVSVTSAYDLCYTDDTYNYYCDSPYTCCVSNTKCCYGSSSFDSSSSYSSSSTSYLTSAVIVGIVIGCLFFVCIVVTVICVCVKQSGHSGRVIQPSGQTTAHPYPQHIVNYTHTSSQYPNNSAMAAQNGPYGNMTAYYQHNVQNLPPIPPTNSTTENNQALPHYPPRDSTTVNQNQNSGDQVGGATPSAPEGIYGSDEYNR